MVARRQELAAALIACADSPCRMKARRFVSGLSSDELQFIAEYLGACILESAQQCQRSRARTLGADQDHKMILLLEYLWRSGAPLAAA